MAGFYRVRQGDTLSSIAFDFGFCSYHRIYDNPRNAEFRERRPDPDLLFPDDLIYIPDREQKPVPIATDMRHCFKARIPMTLIRIAVQDAMGVPLKCRPYRLFIEHNEYKGQTDGNGIVERRTPVRAKTARLWIAGFEWEFQIGDLNPVSATLDGGISGIQMRLKNLGHHPAPASGTMGAETAAAIRDFQARHRPLSINGQCDDETLARLIKEHGC